MTRMAMLLGVAVLIGCQAESGGPAADGKKPATRPAAKPAASKAPVASKAPAASLASKPAGGAVRIEAESFATISKAVVKEMPDASGGKAVVFGLDTSTIETIVSLPPGKYAVVVVGKAADQYQDAMDLIAWAADSKVKLLDGRAVFGSKYKAFVPAGSPPVITVDREKVKLVLRVDLKTGMAVDYVELQPVK